MQRWWFRRRGGARTTHAPIDRVRLTALALAMLCFADARSAAPARVIDGVFVHFGYDSHDNAMPASVLEAYFAELASIGVNTVIVDQVRARTARGCDGPD